MGPEKGESGRRFRQDAEYEGTYRAQQQVGADDERPNQSADKT
jgi:hypothetical protein